MAGRGQPSGLTQFVEQTQKLVGVEKAVFGAKTRVDGA